VNTVGTIEKAFISESLLIYSRDIGISLIHSGISPIGECPLAPFSNVVCFLNSYTRQLGLTLIHEVIFFMQSQLMLSCHSLFRTCSSQSIHKLSLLIVHKKQVIESIKTSRENITRFFLVERL